MSWPKICRSWIEEICCDQGIKTFEDVGLAYDESGHICMGAVLLSRGPSEAKEFLLSQVLEYISYRDLEIYGKDPFSAFVDIDMGPLFTDWEDTAPSEFSSDEDYYEADHALYLAYVKESVAPAMAQFMQDNPGFVVQ